MNGNVFKIFSDVIVQDIEISDDRKFKGID